MFYIPLFRVRSSRKALASIKTVQAQVPEKEKVSWHGLFFTEGNGGEEKKIFKERLKREMEKDRRMFVGIFHIPKSRTLSKQALSFMCDLW